MTEEFLERALTSEEEIRADEQPSKRSRCEKIAFRLLPDSMKSVVKKNPPVAFLKHKAFYPDLFFGDDKFLIEIDGEDHVKKFRQDIHRDNVFDSYGYFTIRIHNDHVSSKITFWTLVMTDLMKINNARKSSKIKQYISDLNNLIDNEMLNMTALDDDYDERWFQYNYDQVDFRPKLYFNIPPSLL